MSQQKRVEKKRRKEERRKATRSGRGTARPKGRESREATPFVASSGAVLMARDRSTAVRRQRAKSWEARLASEAEAAKKKLAQEGAEAASEPSPVSGDAPVSRPPGAPMSPEEFEKRRAARRQFSTRLSCRRARRRTNPPAKSATTSRSFENPTMWPVRVATRGQFR